MWCLSYWFPAHKKMAITCFARAPRAPAAASEYYPTSHTFNFGIPFAVICFPVTLWSPSGFEPELFLCVIWAHLSSSKGPADSSLLVSSVHKVMQIGWLLLHPWKSLPKDARDTAALSHFKWKLKASFPQCSHLSAGCCLLSYSVVDHLESIS